MELPAEGSDAERSWAMCELVFAHVERVADDNRIQCFFFTRKPPGLRLRFLLPNQADATRREVEALMDELVERELVMRWYPSVYEPEVFKFGGPEATDAVHRQFFADSMAWWRWAQLQGSGVASIDPRLVSVAVLNDLFARSTEGPEEVWDVWCHLATLHGDRAVSAGPPAPVVLIDDVLDRVSEPEQALLADHATSNATIAAEFRALLGAGKLLYANRLVLPHLALYHWNRFGFSPHDRASMYTPMIRAWSPHQ